MKSIIWTAILVVVLLAGAVVAYAGGYLDPLLGTTGVTAAPLEAPEAQSEDVAEATALFDSLIVADARVVPAKAADLSLSVTGIIGEQLVQEGDSVEEGQLLLRLRDGQQRTAVTRAEAELRRAQARLAQLLAGARPEEIAAAQATVEQAEAALARIEQGLAPGNVAEGEAALSAARARLAKVYEGASEQELINAKAQLANAEAELTRAQRAYNEVKWRNDVGALPQAAALQTATNNFEAAQARYNDLQTGPSQADVAAAAADVNRAQAQLDTVSSTLPADIAAANAEVKRAQAQLDLLAAGTRPEEIASAEADVAAATAALQQALVALADIELRAPFTGVVAGLDLEVGEQLSAGETAVRLARLGDWEIRTEDLTEFQVIGLEPGMDVALAFDAIPGLEMTGTIERIRPIGADLRGDIVYTVVVAPQGSDDRIRWNMTAVTTFNAE